MKANLHIHSRYSDGTQWPEQIVERAKQIGLELIALTDHDTIAGNEGFIKECDAHGIGGVMGVEIDCSAEFKVNSTPPFNEKYDSEILGYFSDKDYRHTQELLEPIIRSRILKMKHFLKRAQEVFKDGRLNWEGFLEFHIGAPDLNQTAGSFTFMKPHLFNYLKDLNLKEVRGMNYPTFKGTYFEKDSVKDLAKGLENYTANLTVKEVVQTIRKDGGYAVIPHLGLRFIPKKSRTKQTELFRLLKEKKNVYESFLTFCKDLGVWGVEMYYYRDWGGNPEIIKKINTYIKDIAQEKFHFTWGSDCHGANSMSDTLGKFFGEFEGFQ